MKKKDDSLQTFRRFLVQNPYTGSTEQIVNLSCGLFDLKERLDPSTYQVFKEESGIQDKIFSKLRVIGKTLSGLSEKHRQELIKGLPPSYSTIHILCSLKPEELLTSVRTKNVTPSTTVKGVTQYVRQVKSPHLTTPDGEKGRWGSKHEVVWNVLRPDDVPLEGETLKTLEEDLRRVCKEYGLLLQKTTTEGSLTIRQREWSDYSAFWRGVLEKELTPKWFLEVPEDIKKKFDLKNVDEVRDTPLRQFTGFLIHVDGGREKFWETHGQTYVAKVCFLMGHTEDAGTRHNLKRRLEQVLGDRKELSIWYNLMIKNSGLNPPL